ncbi:hypothetical protein BHYA_0218g00070 [Botrytis hyacinthi]|uniref:Uncharacterized protein n=1 Tax=Botrytis hyacinthi TaxID=278943 RepID=A0A4Z1GAF5_9HELO|nr:hypothetical protein BHYA_0218g00070 [Botrytis hyacinthi]
MDQSQERKYCFQTRVFTTFRSNAAYIPGMPTMSAPHKGHFESVTGFVIRYNQSKRHWEGNIDSGGQAYLGITKEKLRKLDRLEIPNGVNKNSLIKPSEDWFKEHPEFREKWESMIKNFRGGEEIIETKPTLESGPSQPVLPPSRAQQSVQPSLNTAGFLLAKPNPNPDLQRHSKFNDHLINPSKIFLDALSDSQQ